LWYLRDTLGLTGTKFGCGVGLCGACTVLKSDDAIRACITPMSSLAGAEIRTIEDIGAHGLHPVQKMWMQFNVPQCGYCQSGQIMQAIALLKEKPKPPTQTLTMAWPRTFAVAALINASELPSRLLRRSGHERD